MFRRLIALLLGFVCLLPGAALAQNGLPAQAQKVGAAVLSEPQSGVTLMAAEAETPLPAAGLARLPALLLACEAFDAGKLQGTDILRVSDRAAAVKGPTAFLSPGEEIAASDLLKSAVMIMAGDALYALCEAVNASEEAFVQEVNRRLAALDVQAVYTDRLGTDVRLSANDLAKLGGALSKSAAFCAYSLLYHDSIQHPSGLVTELTSGNRLLKTYPGCNGVATGSSAEAGYCGVFSVRRADQTLLCVILGAKSAAARSEAATAMLDYAFAVYQVKTLARRGEAFAQGVPVAGGVRDDCVLVAFTDVTAVFPADQAAYTQKEEIPESLQAPLRAGEVLGRITYLDADGNILSRVELTVAEDIPQAVWKDYLARLLRSFLHA